MKPEEKTLQHIDDLLEAASWRVQSRHQMNLGAATGVALTEKDLHYDSEATCHG